MVQRTVEDGHTVFIHRQDWEELYRKQEPDPEEDTYTTIPPNTTLEGWIGEDIVATPDLHLRHHDHEPE